ncbi:LysR family transcriptional regulator [Paraburkholderia sp. SIMBA_053]|uniref:LysR family transcriptional regulator n=1 Tax=Paraburkholderia sp. SIMBA_053 TaxID=3085794 RepID=UPI00397C94C7
MLKSELMSMDVRALVMFCTVAQELHFAKAAERLHMSQPALSHQIKRLEQTVGASLLTRTTRSVRLTPAGTVFRRLAEELCNEIEQMVKRTRQAVSGEAGSISIGLTTTAACSPLAEALYRFRQSRPGIEIDLQELNSVQMQGALRLKSIDVALMRPAAFDADMAVREIYREPMYVAMRPEDDLALRPRLDLQDLSGRQLIGYRTDASPYFRHLVHQAFAHAKTIPSFAQESVLPTLLTLVEAGVGIAVIPESATVSRGRTLIFRKLPQRHELTACIVMTSLRGRQHPLVAALASALRQ